MHIQHVESSPNSYSAWTNTICLVRLVVSPNNRQRWFSLREEAFGGWLWELALSPPADTDGCQDAGGSLKLARRGVLSRSLTDEFGHLDAPSVQH